MKFASRIDINTAARFSRFTVYNSSLCLSLSLFIVSNVDRRIGCVAISFFRGTPMFLVLIIFEVQSVIETSTHVRSSNIRHNANFNGT